MSPGDRIVLTLFGKGSDYSQHAWRPFKKGIEMVKLYEAPDGASAALLRYEPGARVETHRHPGYEHIIVLEGSQSDNHAEYPAGTCLVNAPGTEHAVTSANGCIVLAIWQKPVEFR